MRFDVVIGNPPYNNNMDVYFINNGITYGKALVFICTGVVYNSRGGRIMAGIDFNTLYDKVCEHTVELIYWPNSRDVWNNVACAPGIVIMHLDNLNTYNKQSITCRNKIIPDINSTDVRSIKGHVLNNVADRLLSHLNKFPKLVVDNSEHDKYRVQVTKIVSSYARQTLAGSFSVFGTIRVLESDGEWNSIQNILYTTNNRDEALSFKSYLNSRLVKYIALASINKLTYRVEDVLMDVPSVPFNKVYTDDMLFDMFDIPDDLRDIINKTIK